MILRVVAGVLLGAGFFAPSASAQPEELKPWWGLSSSARPSVLPPGGEAQIVVMAHDVGDAGTSGTVVIADHLPKGVEAVGISGIAGETGPLNRGPVNCVLTTLECEFTGTLRPYEAIEVDIRVHVGPEAVSGSTNTATVSGGGADETRTATQPVRVGGTGSFGFEEFTMVPENVGGSVDTQAGSHPFQLTTNVTFNSQSVDARERPRAFALPKDVVTELPVGLVGNPIPFTQCTDKQFSTQLVNERGVSYNPCPASSAIGVAMVSYTEPNGSYETTSAPIFNMQPLPGEPARLGFKAQGLVSAFLDVSVRTGGDYGVTVSASNLNQLAWVLNTKFTIWGVPGDPRHDAVRGWECLEGFGECPSTTSTSPPPYLAMPTSCETPFSATIRADAWSTPERAGEVATPATYTLPEAIDGCNRLPFDPSIHVTPDSTAASTPTGLNVDIHVPQEGMLKPEGLVESAVKSITVALPEGVAVNPSGGGGLLACSEGEIGYRSSESSPEHLLFTPGLGEPFCPAASRVGTLQIKLPNLPRPLQGAVYLAAQNENPFGSLIAMYLLAEDPVSGVRVKLASEVTLTPSGQLVTNVRSSPQAPFEDAELHFFDGARAPLASPAHCGAYTTLASFAPWSGQEPRSASSQFAITSGPDGSACPGASLPFSPTMTAGTLNVQGGAFSAFTSTISRGDGEQDIAAVRMHMPPGLSGLLSNVKLCGEQQANEGTCGPESLIGETTVSAGVGSEPVTVTGGGVYLTEHYAGAPFGLSIISPVKAGPFDLERTSTNHPACDCVVVRAKIEVDPSTAQLTISTDPAGAHSIPHIIDGIPLHIKHVNVTVNRPNFTFNPTNCAATSVQGSISGSEGATATTSIPFEAANCATLAFTPHFSVSTTGRNTRSGGAGLTVKLTYPNVPFGSQANIAKVKVALPKQLPSRLTTLQKACTERAFTANPATCPPGSLVGHARVLTPLLPVPLEGPAYLVSHGSESFPSLTVVLQGYGVTVVLVGSTFIKKGVTTTTFNQNPDVPFSLFELKLPQGPHSALAAFGSLCKQKLKMPTTFWAQNGRKLHRNTPITVTNCAKTAARKHHPHKKAKRRHR